MIRRALPWVIIGPVVFAVLAVLVFLLLALSLPGRRYGERIAWDAAQAGADAVRREFKPAATPRPGTQAPSRGK